MIGNWILPALLLAGAATAAEAGESPLTTRAFAKQESISAPDGRWDFAAWDSDHAQLLIAHGSDVLLVDPTHPHAVRSVGSLQGAHGVLAIPGTTHLLVTSGKDDTVRVIDEVSGAELARISVAADPDAIVLSADGRTAYVMAAKAGAVSIVDLAKASESGRVQLKPGLEVPVLVTPNLLAVNNEDASEIEFADLSSASAAGNIPLNGCSGPTGLAFDPLTGLALSACANGKAALVDLRLRRQVALLPIDEGPDTVLWDAAHHRFLVPCGKSGSLSIVRLEGKRPIAEPAVQTELSARTAALNPVTGFVYLPAAQFGPPAPGKKRGELVPGSFHVLVMAPRR